MNANCWINLIEYEQQFRAFRKKQQVAIEHEKKKKSLSTFLPQFTEKRTLRKLVNHDRSHSEMKFSFDSPPNHVVHLYTAPPVLAASFILIHFL